MLLPIFACLLSCAEPVSIFVESDVQSAPAKGASVVLAPGDPRIPKTDPTFLYLSGIVSQALVRKGLTPTSTPGDGVTVVGIEWLHEPPKTVSQAAMMADGNFRGVPPSLYQSQTYVRGLSGDPSLADQSTPLDTPDKTRKVTVHPWTIRLKGIDPSGKTATLLWSVTASGDSASLESADILPELIAATVPYIGAKTARREVRVAATDTVVKAIVVGSPKVGPATPIGLGY